MGFDDLPQPYRESWQEQLDNLGEAEVTFELNLGAALVERFVRAAMLDAGAGFASMQARGSVEIKSTIDKSTLRGIVALLAGQEDDENAFVHAFERLGDFLRTRDIAPIAAAFGEVAEAICGGVDEVNLEAEVGVALAGSGKAAAGAKVEVEGSLGGAFRLERDMLAGGAERPTLLDIRDLLLGVGTGGSSLIDVDRYLA